MRPKVVMDVGVASGVTTVDRSALERQEFQTIATDRTIHCYVVDCTTISMSWRAQRPHPEGRASWKVRSSQLHGLPDGLFCSKVPSGDTCTGGSKELAQVSLEGRARLKPGPSIDGP
jgi:hypothetical protein